VPTFAERRRMAFEDVGRLQVAQPAAMEGFSALHRAATADASLSAATKELIALALAVSARCNGCIAMHVAAALDAGAEPDEIAEALSVAVLMGGAPAAVYAGEAMAAVEELESSTGP